VVISTDSEDIKTL